MPTPKLPFEYFFRNATPGSGSNVLSGLGWMTFALLVVVGASAKLSERPWVPAWLLVFAAAYLLAYLCLSIGLVIWRPESLRSERSMLEMKKLERGQLGDSEAGIDASEQQSPSQSDEEDGSEEAHTEPKQ